MQCGRWQEPSSTRDREASCSAATAPMQVAEGRPPTPENLLRKAATRRWNERTDDATETKTTRGKEEVYNKTLLQNDISWAKPPGFEDEAMQNRYWRWTLKSCEHVNDLQRNGNDSCDEHTRLHTKWYSSQTHWSLTACIYHSWWQCVLNTQTNIFQCHVKTLLHDKDDDYHLRMNSNWRREARACKYICKHLTSYAVKRSYGEVKPDIRVA